MEQQVEDFTNHPNVLACMTSLQTKFNGDNPLIISDVIDEEGNQYVHLVQKGGGVLGVALVGYTYILEMMGIRFLKQAGTSAGAINTALMTVIGNKQDIKSPRILKSICELDFFSFVDGHPFARRLIKNFITDGDYSKKVKKWGIIILLSIAFLFAADIILIGLQHQFPVLSFFTGLSFLLTGITLLTIAIIIVYAGTLLKRLKNAGYGINSGDTFYDWIKKQFEDNGVTKVSELNKKARQDVPGLKLRYPHPKNLEGLEGSVTFIASELSNKNKIQLPEMCDLFKKKSEIDDLQPAGFVRASMAIPLFFESYIINDILCEDQEIKDAWLKHFNETDPPSIARFVDGGILSNFPIDLFYNPGVDRPRLPVFGIDLDGSVPGDQGKDAHSWSLGGYFGRIFSTIQNHSDKQFLAKNKVYGFGVGKINVSGFNWLNFFLTPEKKIELFVLGAQAACAFLHKFEWQTYKQERAKMHEELNNK